MRQCPSCPTVHDRSHAYCLRCHAASMRRWRKSHKPSGTSRTKGNARAYANVYRRRGKLIPQPCEICGNSETEMHHTDYSKPLQVRWLCKQHHRALHNAARET